MLKDSFLGKVVSKTIENFQAYEILAKPYEEKNQHEINQLHEFMNGFEFFQTLEKDVGPDTAELFVEKLRYHRAHKKDYIF